MPDGGYAFAGLQIPEYQPHSISLNDVVAGFLTTHPG